MKTLLVLGILLFSTHSTFAHPSFSHFGSAMMNATGAGHLCRFAPENTLQIPESAYWGGGISKKEFKEVIQRIGDYYRPIIEAQGGDLVINENWQASTVNASAEQEEGKWILNMFGGLARHKLMTKDAFAMVMCHEVGHHLGGFPVYKPNYWASNEGQSDYFAVMKCFRRVFGNDNHDWILSTMSIPDLVKEKCSQGFGNPQDILLCQRESMAGLQVARFLDDLRHFIPNDQGPIFEITFEQPDTTEVPRTVHTHPGPQCRLDTYFSGATCPVSAFEDFSRTDGKTGACSMENGNSFGYRPRCWYAPN
jgi:hypothetical protein